MSVTAYTTFVGRDFTARLEAIMTAIRAEVPGLTDLNYSGIANVLSRLLASESDFLAFYQDEAYSETALEYALFKQSLLDQAATVDERGLLASGAQGYLTATKGGNFPITDLDIPRYTDFTRSDALSYLSTTDIVFPVTETSVEIPVIQGTLETLTLTQADFELSEITNRRSYNLGENVCSGTVVVTSGVDPQVIWTEVDSFWQSQSSDNHFLLNLVADGPNDTSDIVYLTLGDGTYGANTFVGEMTVTYIVTAGASGNCGSGVVVDVPGEFSGVISVTNPLPLRGGGPAEENESLRARIPAATRIQRRAVNRLDYPTLLKDNVAGLKYCQAADRSTVFTLPYEYVTIYAVPEGGGALPQQMVDDIYAVLTDKGALGIWEGRYFVESAIEVPVDVTCTIGIVTGYQSASVISAVVTKIQTFLSVDNQTISGTLSFRELFSAIIATAGVKSEVLVTPSSDVTAGVGEILIAGTITVTAG